MKKTILTIIQVIVTLGILVWIFHDPQKRHDMLQAVLQALHDNPHWLIAGITAYGIVEVLGATRWQILLRVQGIYIPWYRLGSLLMIGIFFNQFMPGGTGGDVVKIFYLLKETPGKRGQALLAVLMDRLIGLIGLIFVAGAVIMWKWNWLTQGKPVPHFEFSWLISYAKMNLWLNQIPNTTKLLYFLLAILGFTVVGIITSFVLTGLGLVHKLPARFPKRDIFVDLSLAYNQYARAWKAFLSSILISFGVHACSFMMFYSAAMSLGARIPKIPLFDFCAVMPIINTIASLPISVGGAGVREKLFQTLLNALFGVAETDAWVISLLGASMVLFWGLVGGVIYLFYRPSKHAKLRVIQHEVEELEHEIAETE